MAIHEQTASFDVVVVGGGVLLGVQAFQQGQRIFRCGGLQAACLLVQFGHAADGLGLFGNDGERLRFLRPRIAEGDAAAIPLTV